MAPFVYMELCTIAVYGWGWVQVRAALRCSLLRCTLQSCIVWRNCLCAYVH